MAPKATDRRVQRTRQALREALFAAILAGRWDHVTVGEVCERANVGRSTFYIHFADKEELLLSGFDDLQQELHDAVAKCGGKPLSFVRPMIDHVRAHDQLRVLVGKRTGQAILKRLTQLVADLLADDLAKLAIAEVRRDAAVRYLAGAFVELLTWWSGRPGRMSTAELADFYGQLTAPVIRQLRRSSG